MQYLPNTTINKMKRRTQLVLLAACTVMLICFAQAEESSDMCDFSGLDLEKMVDNIFRRVPASYSTPRDKPLQIIPEITIDAPVIKGLDKFELYGPVFSYCRNGAKLVQVDIVFDRLIELSATWKTCSGTEGVIGTYGTARVTVTFEVVNATREDGLQEKGMKLVLHGYPKAVGVDVVSVYIRGAGELLGNFVAASRIFLPKLPMELLTDVVTFRLRQIVKDLTERP
ncbi:uncharacterized protein LOC119458150 [Dermacentor silvarum]|uniref:uncharacterized protein LOC119458150 n=1 Tax=Dermacentor silvarum TaxID=543639 RepID=UPI0018984189|nr:uncharacterized protein LOC119458150 [Dermacentor silvarum]